MDHPAGSFVVKHHNWGTYYRTAKKALARSTARKTWCDGRFLCEAGVPTPRPRAFFEWRLGPFHTSSYALFDYVPGTSLYRLMRFERPSRDFVRDLARQVAAIWQQLDEMGVWHNDFKTENLLVDPHGKVWLIDMERTRRYRNRERMRQRQKRVTPRIYSTRETGAATRPRPRSFAARYCGRQRPKLRSASVQTTRIHSAGRWPRPTNRHNW